MILELGHFALLLAVPVALMQMVVPFWGARRRDGALMAVDAPAADRAPVQLLGGPEEKA